MSHFGDPTFELHLASAQLLGKLAIRLATQPVLPLDYREYAADLLALASELQATANSLGAVVANVSFEPLLAAIANFNQSANAVAAEVASAMAVTPSEDVLATLNDRLMTAERAFLQDNAIKPW